MLIRGAFQWDSLPSCILVYDVITTSRVGFAKLLYTQQLRLLASWSHTLICCVTVRHTPHLVLLRRFCVSQRGVVPIRLCFFGWYKFVGDSFLSLSCGFYQSIKLLPSSRDSSILSSMALPVVRPWTVENQLQFEAFLTSSLGDYILTYLSFV